MEMNKNFLILEGTNGLGLSLAEKLSSTKSKIIIAGRNFRNIDKDNLEFLKLDFQNFSKDDLRGRNRF